MRLMRLLAAVAVGAGLLAPAAPASASPLQGLAVTGTAYCAPGGWKVDFTATNPRRALSAVVTGVSPEGVTATVPLPVRLGPGEELTGGVLLPRAARRATVNVHYRWQRPHPPTPAPTSPAVPPVEEPSAPATTLPPEPSPSLTPPGEEETGPGDGGDDADVDVLGKRGHGHRPTMTARVVLKLGTCASPSPTVTATTPVPPRPTATPTATASPSAPEPEPSATSTATATPPVQAGAGGSGTGTGGLPLTGAPVAFMAAGGAVLLAVGVGAVWVVRRRRTTFTV